MAGGEGVAGGEGFVLEFIDRAPSSMTLCIAWLRNDHVYLVADSAVTSNDRPYNQHSRFGERSHFKIGEHVEERALKIFRHQDSAIAFAGDADLAREIFSTFKNLSSSFLPIQSIISAWESHTPFNSRVCGAIFVTYCDGKPKIYRFSPSEHAIWCEESAVIGAVNSAECDLLSATMETMPSDYVDPDDVLCLGICAVQRFSIFENFLDRGIGGCFSGVSIGPQGLRWMPPTLHVVMDKSEFRASEPGVPRVISVRSSNDMTWVWNDLENGWKVFANSSGENIGLTSEQLISKSKEVAAHTAPDNLHYRHIVVYHADRQILTVLLVDGLVPSPEVYPRFEQNGFAVSYSHQLLKVVERDPTAVTIAIHDCRQY
jgi:hypothetical protein